MGCGFVYTAIRNEIPCKGQKVLLNHVDKWWSTNEILLADLDNP